MFCVYYYFIPLVFLTCFKPVNQDFQRRPVGRPKKPTTTQQPLEPVNVSPGGEDDSEAPRTGSGNEEDVTSASKRKRGSYKSYSLQKKMEVMKEFEDPNAQVGEIARRYGVPRTTIISWKSELSRKTRQVPINSKGLHLKSGSGRFLSYPVEVDEQLAEWILSRRDCHLPVGRELVKAKGTALIK